jgi:small-conductance mechanosensitive channel
VLLLNGMADAVQDAWPTAKGPGRFLASSLFVLAVIVGVRGLSALARTVLDTLLKPRLVQSLQEELAAGSDSGSSVGTRALVPLIQRAAGVLLWLAGLILVLDHFGQNVSSVVAALGVTSLAIGLASQQALSNIIAGLVLALDHPFRVGDRIRLPGLDSGEVLDIGIRSTQLRLSDGSLLIVPNTDLVSARLFNQSTERGVRAEVRLLVPVPLSVDKLTAHLLEATARLKPAPLTEPPPRVQLLAIGDKLELALILWLPRHADAPQVEEQLRRTALHRIQELLAEPPAPPAPRPAPPVEAAAAVPHTSPPASSGRRRK